MWFDVRAALAQIESGERPAAETFGQANSRNSQPAFPSNQISAYSPSPYEFAEFAATRRTKHVPMTDRARATSAALPSRPPTCAICGHADWGVSVTDMRRRTLHVECWRGEQGGKT